MKSQINFEAIKEKTKKFFSTISKVALVICALIIGAAARDIYVRVINSKDSTKSFVYQKPKSISETSIAINERGELMIIDRNNGCYTLYQDSVGKIIFNMYAAQTYIQNNK